MLYLGQDHLYFFFIAIELVGRYDLRIMMIFGI